MKLCAFYFLLLLMLAGCGATETASPALTGGQKYSLVLFSTPWCEPCEHLLPALDKEIPAAIKERAKIQLYVVTGKKPSQAPTEEIAKNYQQKLNLSFETSPDPWKWTHYKKYFGSEALLVPGAVILDEAGTIVRVFNPGTFSAHDITVYLQSLQQL